MGDPTEISEDRTFVPEVPPRPDLPPSRKEAMALLHDLRREREAEQLRAVLATESGLAVIGRILNRCGVYTKAQVISEADQGARAIGVQLVRDIDALGDDAYPDFLRATKALQRAWKGEDDAAASNQGPATRARSS